MTDSQRCAVVLCRSLTTKTRGTAQARQEFLWASTRRAGLGERHGSGTRGTDIRVAPLWSRETASSSIGEAPSSTIAPLTH
ncbi:hypothetical protein BaRGS_00029553 [Batillaria attramentaria]|uniref:Uncharacterized protein n=1 Tax=Batillaria attramentaria TaxID=370345 RepID=A0ABD0JVU5_9CAEN